MTRRTKNLCCLRRAGGLAAAALLASSAWADDKPDYSANLFGDLGGFREAFAKVGGTLQATETSEVFANPVRRPEAAAPTTTA